MILTLLSQTLIMPTKKSKKSTTKRGRAQDRKLVAGTQKHEVKALAKKKKVSAKKVRDAVKEVGPSRRKVEDRLK